MQEFELEPENDAIESFKTRAVRPMRSKAPAKKGKKRSIAYAVIAVVLTVASMWYGNSHDFDWQSPLIIKKRTSQVQAPPLAHIVEAAELQPQPPQRPELNVLVEQYLEQNNSPLAEVTDTLLTLPTWERILALANAESSLCKRYPVKLANCWGVGGSKLWDMGDNLNDGVIAMNDFLLTNPRGQEKYATMPVARMNGLYKQPAASHWAENVNSILKDLETLKAQAQ